MLSGTPSSYRRRHGYLRTFVTLRKSPCKIHYVKFLSRRDGNDQCGFLGPMTALIPHVGEEYEVMKAELSAMLLRPSGNQRGLVDKS